MATYRALPGDLVQAIQWTGDNTAALRTLLQDGEDPVWLRHRDTLLVSAVGSTSITIATPGQYLVRAGDVWQVLAAADFEARYEVV